MKTTVCLHSSKEYMYEIGSELGLSGEALDMFKFACYEVEIELEVDEKTGEATITSVDGKELK